MASNKMSRFVHNLFATLFLSNSIGLFMYWSEFNPFFRIILGANAIMFLLGMIPSPQKREEL